MSFSEYFDLLLCVAQQVDQEKDINADVALSVPVDQDIVIKKSPQVKFSDSNVCLPHLDDVDLPHLDNVGSSVSQVVSLWILLKGEQSQGEHTPHLDALMSTSMEKSQVKHGIGSVVPMDTSSPAQFKGELPSDQAKTIEIPTQFPDLQLFKFQSVFVKFDDSQFTCKGSKMWTLVKIIGVNKFILLVILDHGEKLVCFPFDRGKLDCYLFLSGPPCLQAIIICVKTSQSRFSQIQSIGFDWRCNMYGIVRDKFLAIPSTSGKEGVMIMHVMDATSLNFGLCIRLSICKAYIFGDDDLIVPCSTLLYFGLLKTFILSPCLIVVKFFAPLK